MKFKQIWINASVTKVNYVIVEIVYRKKNLLLLGIFSIKFLIFFLKIKSTLPKSFDGYFKY